MHNTQTNNGNRRVSDDCVGEQKINESNERIINK